MENIVKFLRRQQGIDITQQELADKINVSRATIINIELGSTPSADVMMRIANFFNKDPRDIFFTNDVAHVQHSQKEQEVS